jgi:CO/xanthine dehydrogenase FAD-binding subunit
MYLRPRTLEEACAALAESGATILAGGTDFYPSLGDRPPPQDILDLSRLVELDGIAVDPREIRIGARTRWSDIARADLPRSFDALRQAARQVGGIQVQNSGTIGGNLCNASPAADGVPALLILDAEAELTSVSGRRRLPLDGFLLGNRRTAREPHEILSAIIVPHAHPSARTSFLKLGARHSLVISIAMVAVLVTVEAERIAQARIAVGACSVVARRLAMLESALAGVEARADLGRLLTPGHLASLSPIDDIRASASYRRDAVATLIGRALVAALAGG